MRKLVVSEFVTLDGIMENPSWTIPFNTEEQNLYKYHELQSSDTILLGRVTYEEFAASWPKIKNKVTERLILPDGFSDRMNSIPKVVVSSTLDEVKWNNSSLIKGDIREAIIELKLLPGKEMPTYFSFLIGKH